MHKSVRQSMACLHSWLGLSFGWLLFAIFLTGAVTYYRHEISIWMQPEFASIQGNQETALKSAYSYLQQHAPDAQSWYIGVANQDSPVNKVYWQKADGGYETKTLDASTGKELKLSATQGGDFFYNFHFQLHGMPYTIGRLIVTVAAFIMLLTLISGIITHKKILTDFFTLRAFKGQRSYLDFHNVSSVIALPFFLTMTFTGLAIFFYIVLPSGMKKLYPDNPFQYFEEIRIINTSATPSVPVKTQMLPIQHFITTAQQHWGYAEFDNITVKQPNTQLAKITLTQLKDESITRNQTQLILNAATGKLLENTRNESAIATLNASMYGLHMARFAEPILRLGLFFSGILGCAMIASGLLLWSLKRQMQKKSARFHLGHYLVNRLNITMIIGLPLSMLGYLYANRFISIPAGAPNYEIYSFFSIWLGSFILACVTPQQHIWRMQLKLLICAAFILPLIDIYYLVSQQYIASFATYWPFLRIELMLWTLALFALFLHQKITPIQQKAVNKIQAKLKITQQESSI
ncbi:PepSY-associated TM helix domain-containing protein [Acinetobacter pseudolwoffii]|uniref:PepSY-associated TM helix domain-containing protein n=1 Tax=Acinetobacter pseudolwoffii TaxID=2053287 RepID=UPI0024689F2C|nr:PepSY-associated TM helix domain-containing protein [Acinetobacter pseudolwoffii]MDH5821316.1 PepSY-associated TM helix domain-containing protein [Acinetobacter pseudolwoffii]